MALKRDWLNFVLPYMVWGAFILFAIFDVIFLSSRNVEIKMDSARIAVEIENLTSTKPDPSTAMVTDEEAMQKVDAYFQRVFLKQRYTEDVLEKILAVARNTQIADIQFSTAQQTKKKKKKSVDGIAFAMPETAKKVATEFEPMGFYDLNVNLKGEYTRIGEFLKVVSRLKLPLEVQSLKITQEEALCDAWVSVRVYTPLTQGGVEN